MNMFSSYSSTKEFIVIFSSGCMCFPLFCSYFKFCWTPENLRMFELKNLEVDRSLKIWDRHTKTLELFSLIFTGTSLIYNENFFSRNNFIASRATVYLLNSFHLEIAKTQSDCNEKDF